MPRLGTLLTMKLSNTTCTHAYVGCPCVWFPLDFFFFLSGEMLIMSDRHSSWTCCSTLLSDPHRTWGWSERKLSLTVNQSQQGEENINAHIGVKPGVRWAGPADRTTLYSPAHSQHLFFFCCGFRSENSCGASLEYNQAIQRGSVLFVFWGAGASKYGRFEKIRKYFFRQKGFENRWGEKWSLFEAFYFTKKAMQITRWKN